MFSITVLHLPIILKITRNETIKTKTETTVTAIDYVLEELNRFILSVFLR